VLALLVACLPAPAAAHVKWFVQPTDPARPELRLDLILSERTALLLVVAVGSLAVLYALQRLAGTPHWPELGIFRLMAIGAPTLLAVQAAIALVYAAVQPALFVPNMALELSPLGLALAAAQLAVAFSFVTGLADWVAGGVVIGLALLAFGLYRPTDALDQLYWVGIGLVLVIIGRFAAAAYPARPWFHRRNPAWSARAVAALRVIAGLAIIAPGLDEKVWNPELGEAFLAERPHFNFPRTLLGLEWCTDERFVLLAGVVEATIGLLLISGLLTRVVILGMWLPFNIGVPFLPPQELLGHLPIFGIMYFLLVHGAGIAPGESLDRPAPPGAPAGQPARRPPAPA
jgi:uncharacterized membrane protein YphA (DoxX/SURF4 family)